MSDLTIKNEDFDEKSSIKEIENADSNKNNQIIRNNSILSILRESKKKTSKKIFRFFI